MRFEMEIALQGHLFQYSIAFELPDRFKELRVLQEFLRVDEALIFNREVAKVSLHREDATTPEAQFAIDWHVIALPIIQDPAMVGPLTAFKSWLARIAILAPIPRLMTGESTVETLEVVEDCTNFSDWLSGLLAQYPAAYATVIEYLKSVMPDASSFRNVPSGKDAKSLNVRFAVGSQALELEFDRLSDGEKCIFVCAVLLSANDQYGPLLVFWDEPEGHLSLSEVGHFVEALKRGFLAHGQFIATSHNDEVILKFSRESTWLLSRASHLEPTQCRSLAEIALSGDLIGSILSGDIDA
jgi:hypothetical protein